MLYRFEALEQLDKRKLMDLYAEGNEDNAAYFYPDVADRAQAVGMAERDFIRYLETDFFSAPGRIFWVLEEDGVWVSALRLSLIREGLYYLEALETHPGYRRHGYAARLLREVIAKLKLLGPFRICDCVSKENDASLRTHKACGFVIASDPAVNYLSGETCDWEYGLEFSYS
ncbi:MAG: GNAT family N-acetyltransferase [Oscillospiraceae bacterium]|nr:GNAT family N-acetyltransferase [Oscillospiraceae bacterium]